MPPLFSVIVPIYNSEDYLVECIQSVLKQDFKDLELILIDDCSTDKSGEVCDSFAKQSKLIKVIRHEKNSGVAVSRNSGIVAACGKYIIFLDSDDYLLDGCLNAIAKLIEERTEADVIIANHNRTNDGGFIDSLVVNANDPDDIIAHINNLSYFIGYCWRYIIKRDFIIKNDLYFVNVYPHEDEEYVARLLCLSRKFSFYKGNFCWHRITPKPYLNLTTDYSSSIACLEIINEMCKFIKNSPLSDVRKQFVYSRIKLAFMYFCAHLFMLNRKEIYQLTKLIEKNINNLKILEDISRDNDIYFFIKTFGAYYGLLLYKAFISEKTISLIKNTTRKELYVFCVALSGRTTARILLKEGYRVKGFLDNKKALQGKTVLGLNVSAPSILSLKSRKELSDTFVIVSIPQASTFEEISSQLEEIGLKKEQIVHKTFTAIG